VVPARPIEVVPSDPRWADRAREERDRLLAAFDRTGVSGHVVDIAHIGSTAVPGLAAKPVIDLMLGLDAWPAPDVLIRTVEDLGYHHRGEWGVAGRHYFTDAPPGHPRAWHVHAVEHGSWFWREHLRFREHLRTHPGEAARYAEVKRHLARHHRHDVGAYTEGKTTFVREALARARTAAGEAGIHDAAATGFGGVAATYEDVRPGYPEAAVAHLTGGLELREGARVVDVGAGTGKLTRLLVPTGAEVIGVEPVPAMREILRSVVPSATVLDGTAEEMPIASGMADAVIAGQAFHWFDPWMALSEAHRVLVDDGGLGLVWNLRDGSVPWVARWTAIVDASSDPAPREPSVRWRHAIAATEMFRAEPIRTFPNPHTIPREDVVRRVSSTSVVAALDPDRRERLLAEFRRVLDTDPDTRGRAMITVPYRTDVHLLRRVA
jgi:GrpB-like predicted nucleotidyltransferase (UPF0157 family)/SAM-dependent methyltransferase